MPRYFPEQNTRTWEAQETTDDYADLGEEWAKPYTLSTTIVVTNEGDTNDAKVKIVGSVDGVLYVDVFEETTVEDGDSHPFVIDDYWPYLKVQIKSASAGDKTTVSAFGAALAA